VSSNLPVKAHASLGASTSHRWMACPGSVRMSDGIPNVETPYAKEGTVAHAVAERCLTNNADPHTLVGVNWDGVEVSEDMAEFVGIFVNYCRNLMETAAKHWIEYRFTLARLNPPEAMFGTSDFAAYDAVERKLTVVDLKYGQGVVVEAKENEQLRYYALGVALDLGAQGYEIETVEMVIVQPRAAHPDGIIRGEAIPVVALVEWAGELLAAARATQAPDAPLVAGSHCRFCPAAAICPERLRHAQSLAQMEFEALPAEGPPKPETLSRDVLARLAPNLGAIEDWIASIRAYLLSECEKGRGDDLGVKLVAKRAMRKWKDEEAVRRELAARSFDAEEYETRKLKSPAQLEKVVGKKNAEAWLTPYVTKESNGYNVVPVSDPREAVQVAPVFPALPPEV
jgi:hypothetical protein